MHNLYCPFKILPKPLIFLLPKPPLVNPFLLLLLNRCCCSPTPMHSLSSPPPSPSPSSPPQPLANLRSPFTPLLTIPHHPLYPLPPPPPPSPMQQQQEQRLSASDPQRTFIPAFTRNVLQLTEEALATSLLAEEAGSPACQGAPDPVGQVGRLIRRMRAQQRQAPGVLNLNYAQGGINQVGGWVGGYTRRVFVWWVGGGSTRAGQPGGCSNKMPPTPSQLTLPLPPPHACTHTHTRTHTCTRAHTHTHTHTHARTHARARTLTSNRLPLPPHTHTYTH